MAARPAAKRTFLIESLEPRQLLTVIPVANFGAIADDGKDDSAAIQRAINSSAARDTIFFFPGTYNVNSALNPIGGGRILQGQQTTLQAGPNNAAIYFKGKGLTITGFTFLGRGIYMDNSQGSMIENLIVDNNTFKLNVTGKDNNSIEFTTGLRNSQITNNVFDPIHGDNGIYGYYWDGLTISNNNFLNGNEGIHVNDQSGGSRNLLIEQNYFSGLHRMGIEYQGGGYNTIVQDNWYENPVMSSVFSQNNDTFAYSIVADRSHNTVVRRNVAIMPNSKDSPDGVGVRIAFELGGLDLTAEDNYVSGGNQVVAVNGTRATGVVQNNQFLNYRQGPSDNNGSTALIQNNGPSVKLTWSLSRGRPGPNHRLDGSGSGDGVIPDVDTNLPDLIDPVPSGLRVPGNLVATTRSSFRVDLSWADTSSQEVGFKIERSTDGKTWTQVALAISNSTSYFDVSLPSSTKLYYRIRSYGPGGNSAYSNVATATTDASPLPPPPPPPTYTQSSSSTSTTTAAPPTVSSVVLGIPAASGIIPRPRGKVTIPASMIRSL